MAKTLTEIIKQADEPFKNMKYDLINLLGECYYEGMELQEELDKRGDFDIHDGYGYYLQFLEACAELANEKWRENEAKILNDMLRSLNVYEDKYCSGWIDGWNNQAEINPVDEEYSYVYLWHDGNYYCGICGNSVDPIFNYCPTCGAIIDLRDVL